MLHDLSSELKMFSASAYDFNTSNSPCLCNQQETASLNIVVQGRQAVQKYQCIL
jgi:hypothetical protein